MKIAMFHWGFPPIIGGVETHLTILCPEVVKRGHKVSLLTGAVEGVAGDYTFNGVRIKRTPLMDLNWLFKRGLENLEAELEPVLVTFLEETKPDVIHVHNLHYFSRVHTEILEKYARKLGVPLVLTAHNAWDESLCLELTLDTRWDAIIAVSHFIKKELMGTGVSEKKIHVVHHGINLERFESPPNPEAIYKKYPILKGRRPIFHPARMGIAKGCDVSIKAMRLIKKQHPNALLILAGTKHIIDWGLTQQKDIAYLLHLIRRFDLEDDTLIDVYTIDEVTELYSISEFCMYPSAFGEPFGLTMLESMASGKPIIVTESGGMPEIVQDNVNGFVIKIKDYVALAEKCIELLDDDSLRHRLGRTGREQVEEKYTAQIMADNTISVYEQA